MNAERPHHARSRRPRLFVVALAAVAASAGVAFAALPSIDAPATVGEAAVRDAPSSGDVAAMYDQEAVDAPVVVGRVPHRRAGRRHGGHRARRLDRHGPGRPQRRDRARAARRLPHPHHLSRHEPVGDRRAVRVRDLRPPRTRATWCSTSSPPISPVPRSAMCSTCAPPNGSTQPFTVAAILPHEQTGDSEMIMTTEAVSRLGVVDDTRAILWNIPSRPAFDAAVAAEGLEGRPNTRVARSWNPPNPDDTLGTARTKQVLGEPWYRLTSSTTIAMHPDWVATNLTAGRDPAQLGDPDPGTVPRPDRRRSRRGAERGRGGRASAARSRCRTPTPTAAATTRATAASAGSCRATPTARRST